MIVLVVCIVFCPIAGAMAYLITMEEYRRHFPDVGRARLEAIRTALLATGVLALLVGIAALVLERVAQ